MKAKHPFEWINKQSQLPVFTASFVVTIFIIVGMQLLGKPLITVTAPAGIISFEFAGDLATAQSIIASWGQDALVYAGLNLGFDYLFMVSYALTIGLGCILISHRLLPKIYPLSVLGVVLAWGSILAALLDALENYALIQLLLGSFKESWPLVARWCAGVKFFLVAIGISYILIGMIISFLIKNKEELSEDEE